MKSLLCTTERSAMRPIHFLQILSPLWGNDNLPCGNSTTHTAAVLSGGHGRGLCRPPEVSGVSLPHCTLLGDLAEGSADLQGS